MSGRRRSGAWLQKRPLSASTYRLLDRGALSGSFPRHAGKRASQSAAIRFILLMVYQRSEIRYEQLAMARATSLKLVMRHFAPSPTSDARRCCAAAACGLRRALRAAVMRLCASCLFTSRKEIFFTHQSILYPPNGDKPFIGCSEADQLASGWMPFALSGRF